MTDETNNNQRRPTPLSNISAARIQHHRKWIGGRGQDLPVFGELLMRTLLRKNELLNLLWKDIDWGSGTIAVPAERMKMRKEFTMQSRRRSPHCSVNCTSLPAMTHLTADYSRPRSRGGSDR
jgi:hypothetical protein